MRKRLVNRISTRLAVLCALCAASGATGQEGAAMNEVTQDGARDFDFLMGTWKVHNRRLRERLEGSTSWDEFEATNVARPLLGGVGNEDEFRTEYGGGLIGMSLRLFDRSSGQWSIYWADNRTGVLQPPVIGGFRGDTGVFEGADTFEGRPIRVRFTWTRGATLAHWEQAFSADGGKSWETNWTMDFTRDARDAGGGFPVVELRRYAIKPGERDAFAQYFDSYFPEAFQQLGAVAFGQFLERTHDTWFTWLRGFPSLDARATINADFYYGPLWKAHATTMNDRMLDSDNVLLLQPLRPERGVVLLPAVDPVAERRGAQGVVVAQIFPVQAGRVEDFARQAESVFGSYRAAGAREAGVLVSLDVPNNFPKLPFRTDGPYLVWLGVLENDEAATRFASQAERATQSLSGGGLLRGAVELVPMDPTPRSRLRWLPESRR